jgi:hypothetical protein
MSDTLGIDGGFLNDYVRFESRARENASISHPSILLNTALLGGYAIVCFEEWRLAAVSRLQAFAFTAQQSAIHQLADVKMPSMRKDAVEGCLYPEPQLQELWREVG